LKNIICRKENTNGKEKESCKEETRQEEKEIILQQFKGKKVSLL
jgi:hypothetical protein